MTDPIATLRRYTSVLPTTLARRELMALRESALDLSRIPEGWAFSDLCAPGLWDDGGIDYRLQLDKIDGDLPDFVDGTGLTPKAALDVAIKRAKERT